MTLGTRIAVECTGEVPEVAVVHSVDCRLDSVEVLGQISVQLVIEDMARIRNLVVRCFHLDLVVKSRFQGIVEHMAVRIVALAENALQVDIRELLLVLEEVLVDVGESSGHGFRRGGETGPVEVRFLLGLVDEVADMLHDGERVVVDVVVDTVSLAGKQEHRLGEPDVAD